MTTPIRVWSKSDFRNARTAALNQLEGKTDTLNITIEPSPSKSEIPMLKVTVFAVVKGEQTAMKSAIMNEELLMDLIFPGRMIEIGGFGKFLQEAKSQFRIEIQKPIAAKLKKLGSFPESGNFWFPKTKKEEDWITNYHKVFFPGKKAIMGVGNPIDISGIKRYLLDRNGREIVDDDLKHILDILHFAKKKEGPKKQLRA